MTRYQVRPLYSSDLGALRQLEAEESGDAGDAMLCSHYVRLCTEFSGRAWFLALVDSRPAGCLLCFVRDLVANCTTLVVRAGFQRTRVTPLLLASFVRTDIDAVDPCWFTVKPDLAAARSPDAMRGANEIGKVRDFFGPGDERIVSKVDHSSLEPRRQTYEQLGLIPRQAVAA